MTASRHAVILLSGGLDSAVALGVCKHDGYLPHALTIDYGQRNEFEQLAAARVAVVMGVNRHVTLKVDLTQWGGSALTSADMPVPRGRTREDMEHGIPSTYVPARNTIFLSLAMGWAESLGTGHIYIGAHALDYSGYPDCRPEYFDAFTRMAELATKTGVEGTTRWQIHTPLLHKTKSEIIQLGMRLGVPLEHTLSCYQPFLVNLGYAACGVCDACTIRRQAFARSGVKDPTIYMDLETAQQ